MSGRRLQGDQVRGRHPDCDSPCVPPPGAPLAPGVLRRARPDGLVFVGEKGAPFPRSTSGREWRKAREIVGPPEDFRFYDLRHTVRRDQWSRARFVPERLLAASPRTAQLAPSCPSGWHRTAWRACALCKKDRVSDLGLSRGAGSGDENRTRALSSGSCGHLWSVRGLTWGNSLGGTSSDMAAFPVIPRCSPLDLVRLWCGRRVHSMAPLLICSSRDSVSGLARGLDERS